MMDHKGTKAFIETVKRYTCLYDKSHNDADVRVRAWEEIAAILGLDGVACKNKWRNLRDYFNTYLAREASSVNPDIGSRRKPPKKWCFAQDMAFVTPYLTTRNNLQAESVVMSALSSVPKMESIIPEVVIKEEVEDYDTQTDNSWLPVEENANTSKRGTADTKRRLRGRPADAMSRLRPIAPAPESPGVPHNSNSLILAPVFSNPLVLASSQQTSASLGLHTRPVILPRPPAAKPSSHNQYSVISSERPIAPKPASHISSPVVSSERPIAPKPASDISSPVVSSERSIAPQITSYIKSSIISPGRPIAPKTKAHTNSFIVSSERPIAPRTKSAETKQQSLLLGIVARVPPLPQSSSGEKRSSSESGSSRAESSRKRRNKKARRKDPTDCYFLSLADVVKRLPPAVQSSVKMKISQVIFEAEMDCNLKAGASTSLQHDPSNV